MEHAPFSFDGDGQILLNWASSHISPGRRRMAAAVGLDNDDLRQEAALRLLRSPPPDGIARSTAVMHATRWAAAHVGIHFDSACRNGEFRTFPADDFSYLRAESQNLHEQLENQELAHLALRQLPRRWRTVIELRFGLGQDRFERTHEQVAKIMGLTNQRICEIEKSAMAKLRSLRMFQAA